MDHPGDLRENSPKIIVGAKGVRITDIDGHETIDGVGGLWNVNLGYSCDPVKEAIADQLQNLPYYSTFAGTSSHTVIELSYMLSEWLKKMNWSVRSLLPVVLTRSKRPYALPDNITKFAEIPGAPSFFL